LFLIFAVPLRAFHVYRKQRKERREYEERRDQIWRQRESAAEKRLDEARDRWIAHEISKEEYDAAYAKYRQIVSPSHK
jgi:hypothetical protein